MLGNDDLRECENRLVEDLGFEHFAVIRKLLKNRHKVYFCTLLGQAQNAEEKENVLREMKRSIDGIRVLELVQSETGRARRKAHGRTDTNVPSSTISSSGMSRIKEGHGTRSEVAMEIDEGALHVKATKTSVEEVQGLTVGRTIDLEELHFVAGNRHMTNKKCALPKGSYRMTKKGYEQVFVPGIKHSAPEGEKLVKIEALPRWV